MELTKDLSPTTRGYWRIVLTLAAKDIVDAIKNKTTLTIIIGLGFTIITVQALPLLLKLDSRPRVAIYDAGRTELADELRRARAVQLSEQRSAKGALYAALESSGPLVGVVLPADWQSGSGPLTVEGYLAYWVRPKTAQRLIGEAERTLTAVTGRPVTIESQVVYPTLENRGHFVMVALGLILVTILISAILVPNLILEEKTAHTLEVLRVSPASINQVLLGKGAAGMIYGLLAAAGLLALNLSMVSQWGLMLVAVLAITLFGTGLGLLVGSVAENEGMVQMWVGLLSLALMIPVMMVFVNSDRLPAWGQQVMAWLPTTAAFDLIRISFGNAFPAGQVWSKLAALVIAVALVFVVAAWRLRTWEAR